MFLFFLYCKRYQGEGKMGRNECIPNTWRLLDTRFVSHKFGLI